MHDDRRAARGRSIRALPPAHSVEERCVGRIQKLAHTKRGRVGHQQDGADGIFWRSLA